MVMYDGIQAYGGIKGLGAIAAMYFIILFVTGNFILLNVFLAIAVDNLSTDEDEAEGEPEPEAVEGEGEGVEAIEGGDGAEKEKVIGGDGFPVYPDEHGEFVENEYETGEINNEDIPRAVDVEEEQPIVEEGEGDGEGGDSGTPPIPEGSSFFIFGQTNPIRVFCWKVQAHPICSNLILVCILVSSAFLACEDPLQAASPINVILVKFDYFFTTVFTIECTLKLISYGFLFHPGAFCRTPFNVLDVVVVTVSLISIFGGSGIGFLKILRVLRVLRPLRAINRAPGLKQVVQCMIVSIKSIGNIMAVTVLLIFMFGVIGVQLFKGKFFICSDLSMDNNNTCQGEFITYQDGDINKPIVEERLWERSEFHYDNILHAMLTLFVVATFEGWPG